MPTIRMNREQMQGGYTVLPNQILRTREMSYKARYLLAQMLSMSEAWQYTVAGMAKVCGMGRDAVRTAMVELETLGYLARSQSRANGRFSHNVYIIREVPVEVEAAPAEAELQALPKEDDLARPAASTAPSTLGGQRAACRIPPAACTLRDKNSIPKFQQTSRGNTDRSDGWEREKEENLGISSLDTSYP